MSWQGKNARLKVHTLVFSVPLLYMMNGSPMRKGYLTFGLTSNYSSRIGTTVFHYMEIHPVLLEHHIFFFTSPAPQTGTPLSSRRRW